MQPVTCMALFLSLATFVTASPHPQASSIFKRGDEEVHVFKRDAPLTPDDLIVAGNHGVNTTEMFKHSVVKRRGEEDVTIWVDNSFEEKLEPEEDPAIPKRAVKIIDNYSHSNGWAVEQCRYHDYNNDTGPNAPCTGGLIQMRLWATENNGRFRFEASGNPWRTLLAAGSNTGCNGRLRAQKRSVHQEAGTGLGNVDIFHILNGSFGRGYAKTYDGRARMRSHGHVCCGVHHGVRLNWQVTDWAERV